MTTDNKTTVCAYCGQDVDADKAIPLNKQFGLFSHIYCFYKQRGLLNFIKRTA